MAGPSGLVTIPIADILGHRELNWYSSLTGRDPAVDKGITWGHGLTYGFLDRLEFGYDNDFRGTTTLDVKIQLVDHPKAYAVSVGMKGIDMTSGTNDKYIVGRIDRPGYRIHVGCDWLDVPRAMLGVDFGMPKGLTAMVETTFGEHGYTWFGVNGAIPYRGANVTASFGIPNTGGDGTMYQLMLNIPFKG